MQIIFNVATPSNSESKGGGKHLIYRVFLIKSEEGNRYSELKTVFCVLNES